MIVKSVGFPKSTKENEKRRVILPKDVRKMKFPEKLFFESGYGTELGVEDDEYSDLGCKIVDRATTLKQKIICDPKIGDERYLETLQPGQIIFGWIHATQNVAITEKIVNSKLTAFAWEKMFEQGRHVFWENNVLAGEAAVMHAFQCYGKLPYGMKVALLGRGNTARGALKVLDALGAKTEQFGRKTEKLFKDKLSEFDVIVNCIMWDVHRKDHIIYKSDLSKLKNHSMIIDVSCDGNGGIETSVPTSIKKPTYEVNGIVHYVVDHTPALFFKTFTENNSKIIFPYIDRLMTDSLDTTLENALIIKDGEIMDHEIYDFQN